MQSALNHNETVKRIFVINSKTDKGVSSKKLYLLKGLIVVKPKIGVLFGPDFSTLTLNISAFQSDIFKFMAELSWHGVSKPIL